MSDSMREAFEQQWYGYWASIGVEIGNVFQRDNDGDYVISAVEDAWQGWQLALKHEGRDWEPFAYCFTDVNGEAKELCSAPTKDDDPRDMRTVTALYKHPPEPVVESANASYSQVCVPEGQHMMPTEFLREYLELLNESDFRPVHKMIRQNMIEDMLAATSEPPHDR